MMFYIHLVTAGVLVLLAPLTLYLGGRRVMWFYVAGAMIYHGEARKAGKAGELMEQRYLFIASGLLALAAVFVLIMTRKEKKRPPNGTENVGLGESKEQVEHD